MQTEVFLHSSYAIALSVSNDLYHNSAIILADALMASKTNLVTTHAVMLEIGNAFQNNDIVMPL